MTANVGDTLVIHNDCPNDTYVNIPYPSSAVLAGLDTVAAISPGDSWTATATGLGAT